MSIADLIGQLKEAEEAFEETLTLLQQDGKLYLTEEWDAWRKKCKAENHSSGGTRGGGAGKGHSKPKKEQMHVMQDEEEGLLLLVTATSMRP
jgi:hypothetical protein